MIRPAHLILPSVLLFAGCATLSQDECLTGNWQSIGYADGVNGQSADRVNDHNKACSKHGVTIDFDTWMNGYTQGLDVYCTADNGAWIAATGTSHNSVCTGPRGADFQYGYHAGQEVYEAKQTLYLAHQDYEEAQNRLDRLQQNIQEEETYVNDTTLSNVEHDAAQARLRQLEREYGRNEQELLQIQYDIDGLEQDVSVLQDRLRNQFPAMKTF